MAQRNSSHALANAGMTLPQARKFSAVGFAGGADHLWAELERLDLLLERQALRLRARRLINESEFRGLYLSDAQVDALLNRNGHAQTAQQEKELQDIQTLSAAIEEKEAEIAARVQASLQEGLNLPLVRLARLFALTPFEMDALLLCVAPELEQKYETLYAYVQNDVTKKHPTVGLALKLFCRTREERLRQRHSLTPDGALFRHQLLRFFDDPQERDPAQLSRGLKADERACDFLLEHNALDNRLLKFAEAVTIAGDAGELALPEELKKRLARAAQSPTCQSAVFLFHGASGVGKRAAAEAICAERGTSLIVADMRQAIDSEQSFALTLALLRREARLRQSALYLAHLEILLADDAEMKERLLILARELAQPDGLIFLGSEADWHPVGCWRETYFLSFKFPLPEFPLRLRLWEQALKSCGYKLAEGVEIAAVAGKFILSGGQIADAVRDLKRLLSLRAPKQRRISMSDLHFAARQQSNQNLSRLAQKVEPVYAWTDIVLPPRAMQQLREVCVSVKHRHVVHSEWGFDRKLSLGKGLNILFSGSSGTGKTMAAQILACELSLDLYKIDLSTVISKYIGETEQNLSRIFREAESSNAILFFDEADALFGKRSEVKDAHDRYANIEVAYLLQKMEEYQGIVILATNLSQNLDEAFARRMRHTVEFPFPDATHREHIWRNIFPAAAPRAEDVDLGFLASQFELSGGNIRNVALAAAFLAAAESGQIQMKHLILSTARELQKLGKLPSKAHFRDYYELIRERS